MSENNIENLLIALAESIRENSFIKLSLGNYKGSDAHLQKILVRLIETKKGVRLFFLFRFDTRDTAKNYPIDEGIKLLREYLGTDFFSAHLFTSANDYQLDIGKKGRSRLNRGKPTFTSVPALTHDRRKKTLIDPGSFYLKALGITTDDGKIRTKQRDKWKQINRFVETMISNIENSELADSKKLKIIDMGSGKGYLTFAAYDYFANIRGIEIELIGVDVRSELVTLCNDIALASGFTGLQFVEGTIQSFETGELDILIALHACDTATDDAIFKGISNHAKQIVVAPCCHQQIRSQIQIPELLKGVLRHGAILEREAESITDGLRSLILEANGYSTRIFEFIATEHTPKNNMIVGKRMNKSKDENTLAEQIKNLKNFYGISNHHLETLLSTR